MNRPGVIPILLLITLTISACGGGGSTSSDGDPGTTTATTKISGNLTGDTANVGGVVATSATTNSTYLATLGSTARTNGFSGAPITFSVEVPTGDTYWVSVVDSDNKSMGTVSFDIDVTGSATTDTIPVMDETDIDFGDCPIPDGTGADGVGTVEIVPGKNPLQHMDQDHDGMSDWEDSDDDNDGVDDQHDGDHHGNMGHDPIVDFGPGDGGAGGDMGGGDMGGGDMGGGVCDNSVDATCDNSGGGTGDPDPDTGQNPGDGSCDNTVDGTCDSGGDTGGGQNPGDGSCDNAVDGTCDSGGDTGGGQNPGDGSCDNAVDGTCDSGGTGGGVVDPAPGDVVCRDGIDNGCATEPAPDGTV